MQPNVRLKRERERRGWSQARVAEQLGVFPQCISRWERGAAKPYPYFREKLCALFEEDAETLGFITTDEDVQLKQHNSPVAATQEPKECSPATAVAMPTPLIDRALPRPLLRSNELRGREALLLHIKQRLMQTEIPTWTVLQGLPGSGKTALALALACDTDLRAHFQGGVFWATLGPEPDLLSHLSRWGIMLGCPPQKLERVRTYEKLAAMLRVQASQQRFLVILDDVWNIDTALALWLGGPHSTYLITTRMPLVARHFAASDVWPIRELNEHESLSVLTHFAPHLFMQHSPTLQFLLQYTGGLPLALTLIGHHLRTQTATNQPHRLTRALEQLKDGDALLALSEPRALVDYQYLYALGETRSLSTAIATSDKQLQAEERQVFYTLSLFPPKPHSFAAEAALAICQTTMAMLDRLSDIGLLESPEPHRYHYAPVIMSYARINLSNRDAAELRFIDYMLAFLEEERTHYNTLDREYPNILAALTYAWQRQMAIPYIRGVLALTPFLELRSAYRLAEEHLLRAYQSAQSLNEIAYMLVILYHLGQMARAQHLPMQAETYLREGLVYARRLADRKMENHFLLLIAEVLEERGEYAQAHSHLSKGVTLARYLKDNERARYHRVPITYCRDYMCVYFTEPQTMLKHGYLADVDHLFRTWRHSSVISSTALQVVRGPDEHIYGVPIDRYVLCLAYNRRLFRQAGLDPDHPPTTWEEFRQAAKQTTQPQKGIYGFATGTIYGQGGWHLTNWFYTAGIQAQTYRQERWQATFNTQVAAEFLDMLREMRFTDQSIPPQTLLSIGDTFEMFNAGRLAMIVNSPYVIAELYKRKEIDIADIGLAPMPQHGGNSCLMGGAAYVFNATSSERAIHAAFAEVTEANFQLDNYEEQVQSMARNGMAIGFPHPSIFTSEMMRQRDAIIAKYINLPIQHYRFFTESTLVPQLEPPIETQKYYALLDPVLQSVLTNAVVQPQVLLDTAARQFQEQSLAGYL